MLTNTAIKPVIMNRLDEFVDFIGDGKWHYLEDISEALSLTEKKVRTIMFFLAKYDLIKLDRESRIRIDPKFREILPTSKIL